jgi:hypothetical protein
MLQTILQKISNKIQTKEISFLINACLVDVNQRGNVMTQEFCDKILPSKKVIIIIFSILNNKRVSFKNN